MVGFSPSCLCDVVEDVVHDKCNMVLGALGCPC